MPTETSRTFVMDAHILRYLEDELGKSLNFTNIKTGFVFLAEKFHRVPGTSTFIVAKRWLAGQLGIGERSARTIIEKLVKAKVLVPVGYKNPKCRLNKHGEPSQAATRFRWGSPIRGLFADARRVVRFVTEKPSQGNPSQGNPSQLLPSSEEEEVVQPVRGAALRRTAAETIAACPYGPKDPRRDAWFREQPKPISEAEARAERRLAELERAGR